MSAFLPHRASPWPSPRPIPKGRLAHLSSMDITTTSATSSVSAALSGLSPKDVELIDGIIERSPPSATTFLTVFKAYNEVLHERGMDAANDVVYYKILLKLGVVKGKDWGTKWKTVKQQQGYGYGNVDASVDEESETSRDESVAEVSQLLGGIRDDRAQTRDLLPAFHRHRVGPMRPSSRRPVSAYGVDSVTVHSHRDDRSEITQTETETDTGAETETVTDDTIERTTDDRDATSSPTTLIQRASDTKENALRLSTEPPSYPPLPTVEQFLPVHARNIRSIHHGRSELSSEVQTRTSTPPPHKLPPRRQPFQPARHQNIIPATRLPPIKAPKKQPSHSTSVDEEDTWKKLRMIRDEKEADKFREVMLIERCWGVWKGSLQWLITMNEKVDEERDKTLIHDHLQKWRVKLHKKRSEYDRIGRRHDKYLLRVSFAKWKSRAASVQVTKWKEDMRRRMSLIKTKRDQRIRADVWIKWRQVHQYEVAELYYERHLLRNTIRKWRGRLFNLGNLEIAADRFGQSLEDAQVARVWNFWKLQVDLRDVERVLRARMDARIKDGAMQTWKQKMLENRKVDAYHDRLIKKHFYRTWKSSLSKQRALIRKADKYKNRQDGILIMAVFRMWMARERGMLMDRARGGQLLHSVWAVWKSRLAIIRANEARALEFRSRPSSALASAALVRWRQTLLARQNLLSQARQYDHDVLIHRTLLVWRVKLRIRLKMAKHAKVARKYLLMRQAWNRWKELVEEKRREEKLQVLQLKLQRKYYERWRSICVRQQYHQLALKQLQVAISTSVLANALSKWTNRVIAIKLRELEIVETHDQKILSLCYQKWKAVSKRHSDDLRLMQSYQYVKREEMMRRMFFKWHAAAKTNRHRRIVLQEREEEMKLIITERAWDKWRERYKAERLRPLEYKLAIQLEKSRLYQVYLIWHSKTRSIPAIQFFSSRRKAKFWQRWRDTMPKALQAREARDHDKQKVLARVLDKWTQAYRTKIALKAVARARYLRLPSGAPRQSLPLSTALHGILRSTPSITSGKATRPVSPTLGDRYSERALSVQEDDSASRAGSTGAPRRRLSALRATKLSLARPVYSVADAPKENNADAYFLVTLSVTARSFMSSTTAVASDGDESDVEAESDESDGNGYCKRPMTRKKQVQRRSWMHTQKRTLRPRPIGKTTSSAASAKKQPEVRREASSEHNTTEESDSSVIRSEPRTTRARIRRNELKLNNLKTTPSISSRTVSHGHTRKRDRSESPFIEPSDEKELWRMLDLYEEHTVELANLYQAAPERMHQSSKQAGRTVRSNTNVVGTDLPSHTGGRRESLFVISSNKEELLYMLEQANEQMKELTKRLANLRQATSEGTCRSTKHTGQSAQARKHCTSLPLDAFIGDATFEKHAEIEPASVQLRRDIVNRELQHWEKLNKHGKQGAEELMRKLGLKLS
ncbi:uncharacterized protein FOMMEDRAFT_145354 [Fomitiporia mediterranea MF3/22]|uniref:uncharacterized protein n=1 Tax=Fomitiporia mediterranea (strain MF3/22) TaxID=694068 RepID=UPI0004407470|nr:uncharacterized protein FOMMEDRAFT_145354 [Fomitiporia mediterranea MF3/22]EJD06031.1 hypothetical protein FOMMEDRAFT_145354 [Fomitiporia mediterranea MF3/22]